MKVHELKTWPVYFKAVADGFKTFEIRENDRGFRAGDILRLQEYDPELRELTGRAVEVMVLYVLDAAPFVPEGYVCMSIKFW